MSRTRTVVIAALVCLSLALLALSGCGVSAYVDLIEYASVDDAYVQSTGASDSAFIASDGSAVAFQSLATTLVTPDANAVQDVFVRNLGSGQTTRASISTAGIEGNGESSFPSVSADGSRVAFLSASDNLVAGDLGGRIDVFVRDLTASTTTMVSIATDGSQANRRSNVPVITADGDSVAFTSAATNLGADANTIIDVFLHDMGSGATTLLSLASGGSFADANSGAPYPNADGTVVAFTSLATNLVVGDGNAAQDIFVRDIPSGTTTLVSRASDGTLADGLSSNPSISADGRYVAFASDATNLVADDTNGLRDVFVHDRTTGTTTRVSVTSAGEEATAGSFNPAISPDGQFVAFNTGGALESNDANGRGDVYVYNQSNSQVCRVSWERDRAEGDAASTVASLSQGARLIAFQSLATNLTNTGDANVDSDVLVATTSWDSVAPTTTHDAPSGWQTTSPVTVTLSPTDASEPDEGGFAPFGTSSVTYEIDGTVTSVAAGGFPPIMPPVQIVVTDEGLTTIDFSALDAGGNQEATQRAEVRIDTVDPSVSGDVLPSYSASALITLAGADGTSGLDAIYYELTLAGVPGSVTFQEYTGPISVTAVGTHQLRFYSADAAGNESEIQTAAFAVVAAAPPITPAPTTPAPSAPATGGGLPWTGGEYIYLLLVAVVCALTGIGLRATVARRR